MASISARQEERAFAEVKRVSSAGLGGPGLLRRVAKTLGRTVPFDAYCASTTDPATNLMTHGVAEGMAQGGEEGDVFFDRIYFDESLNRFSSMLRERRLAQSLSEATGGRPERSLRNRELLEPLGFAHEVSGLFPDGAGLWGGMDLIRGKGSPDFDAREARLLNRVAPHVGAGLRTAALRLRAETGHEGPGVPGVLTLDHEGKILSRTPAAHRWLEDLEDLHPGWPTSEPPIPVKMVAGALSRTLSPTSHSEATLIPRLRVRGRSGRWLTLHGSLTEPANGQQGETVVVIEPARAEDVAWLNVASYGLTSREQEIVRLVARARSTREISQTLFIYEYTVHNHLRSIFEKTGVSNRRELTKRLFLENPLPGMLGN